MTAVEAVKTLPPVAVSVTSAVYSSPAVKTVPVKGVPSVNHDTEEAVTPLVETAASVSGAAPTAGEVMPVTATAAISLLAAPRLTVLGDPTVPPLMFL